MTSLSRVALCWLGLATAGFALVLACEWLLRGIPEARASAAVYLTSLALSTSARFSLGVGVFHAARLWLARLWPRPLAWLAAGLCALAALPGYELSSSLVEGAWISELRAVRAVQGALLVLLLLGWLGLWSLHLWGVAPAFRQRFAAHPRWSRALESAFWLAGVSGLALLAVALSGLLRPYGQLSERLLFPGWLLAATLAFRLHGVRPRLAFGAALAVLTAAAVALASTVMNPDGVAALRAHALGSGGLLTLAEQRAHARPPRGLGRFDFGGARSSACASTTRLPALPLSAAQRRNVILLSIDTMRRDAIGKRYGERAVAPNLEAFEAESIFFERAVAPAPITLYSLGSLLTGHSVSQLLFLSSVPDNVFRRTRPSFDRQHVVLPDWKVFRKRRVTSLIEQQAVIDYVPRRKDPTEVFIAELEAARARRQRVFFWLHLVDPHAPYSKRAGFDFGDAPADRYYGEVAYDDALLGRVLDRLRATGYFEDSLIVIFSDHGESLGEDGYFGHGVSVLGRFTDVPLYVRHPGVKPRRSSAPVSLTSIAATVLHYLNAPIPGSFADCSLLLPEQALASCPLPVSAVHGVQSVTFDEVLKQKVRSRADLERRQARLEERRRFEPDVAITSADHRYVLNLKSGSERLYDRARDPREQHSLIAERPELAARFRAQLARWRRDEAQRIVCDLEATAQR